MRSCKQRTKDRAWPTAPENHCFKARFLLCLLGRLRMVEEKSSLKSYCWTLSPWSYKLIQLQYAFNKPESWRLHHLYYLEAGDLKSHAGVSWRQGVWKCIAWGAKHESLALPTCQHCDTLSKTPNPLVEDKANNSHAAYFAVLEWEMSGIM